MNSSATGSPVPIDIIFCISGRGSGGTSLGAPCDEELQESLAQLGGEGFRDVRRRRVRRAA